MKRVLMSFTLGIFALIASFFCFNNTRILAEEFTISLSCELYLNEVLTTNNEAPFINTTKPYNTYTIKIKITSSPDFASLTQVQQDEIKSNLKYFYSSDSLNYTEINTSESEIISDEVKIDLDIINLEFDVTLLKPITFSLKAIYIGLGTEEAPNAITSQTLTGKYASFNNFSVSIEHNDVSYLGQNYIDWQELVSTANLEPQGFIDPNLQVSYSWRKGTDEISTNQILTLTQSDVVIGATQYNVYITYSDGITTDKVSNRFTINVSDSAGLTLNLTTSNKLEQTLGGAIENVVISASLPISTNYTIMWYIKFPNTAAYKKTEITTSSYTFNVESQNYSVNGYGEYKIKGIAKYSNNTKTATSQALVIKINPAQLQLGNTYKISKEVRQNTKSSLEAYKFTINVESNIDPNSIVWLVDDSKMALGTQFIFEPEIASVYNVTVKSISKNGVLGPQIAPSERVEPKLNEGNNIILYCLAAIAGLSILLAISIIVSNKKREKIW